MVNKATKAHHTGGGMEHRHVLQNSCTIIGDDDLTGRRLDLQVQGRGQNVSKISPRTFFRLVNDLAAKTNHFIHTLRSQTGPDRIRDSYIVAKSSAHPAEMSRRVYLPFAAFMFDSRTSVGLPCAHHQRTTQTRSSAITPCR